MKYNWIVVSGNYRPDGRHEVPDIQCGTVNSFEEAIKALADWHGEPVGPPHKSYQILPVPETEAEWRSML